MEAEQRYVSFLVRLWQEPGDEEHGTGWRGSVEHVQTGEKRYFSDMESLMAYLRTVAESEDKVMFQPLIR
jgi:hypothetical protein